MATRYSARPQGDAARPPELHTRGTDTTPPQPLAGEVLPAVLRYGLVAPLGRPPKIQGSIKRWPSVPGCVLRDRQLEYKYYCWSTNGAARGVIALADQRHVALAS